MKKNLFPICVLLTLVSCGTQRVAVAPVEVDEAKLEQATSLAKELQRQNDVFAQLEGKDFKEMIGYYKEHPQDSAFLTPVIAGSIRAQLEAYPYRTVRGMRNMLIATPFAEQAEAAYISMREAQKPQITEAINNQRSAESALLDETEVAVRAIIAERTACASQEIKQALMAAEFPSTHAEVDRMVAELSERHFNEKMLDSLAARDIASMARKANDGRLSCYEMAVGDSVAVPAAGMVHLARIGVGHVPAPLGDNTVLYELADAKRKEESSSVVAKVLTKAIAVGRLLGTARDKANEDRKEESVAAFFESYRKALSAEGEKAANSMVEAMRKEVVSSSRKFEETVYERY